MTSRLARMSVAALCSLLLLVGFGPAATAQSLPQAPSGAIGEVLSPLEDLIGEISGPLGDLLGDIPLDNAVTLSADDAVDAAVALSLITFDTAETVFIGRDDVFADTLSSVAGQGIEGSPLLLTQTDALDARTVEEMSRLGVSNVIILGSTQAISEGVEQELVATYGAANVTRYGGPSRIETAAELAAGIAPSADHVVLLRAYPEAGADQAQAYADALSAGPFASINGVPSLLTTTDYLHPATEAYLQSAGVERVTIIGGTAAVGQEVEDTLLNANIQVTRVAGANRWDTSIRIANEMGMLSAADANRLIVSEGGSIGDPLWAAGFAAAAHGAVYQSPVILVDGPLLPPETISFIADGLIANALRLSNEPVICNSFVDFLACETVALLMLGTLDEVNALTGGALETVLGPLFGPLSELLNSIVPGPGDAGPGLLGQIAGLLGVGGTEDDTPAGACGDGIDNDSDGSIDEADECGSAAFAQASGLPVLASEDGLQAVLAGVPAELADAFEALVGPAGNRVSPTVQAVVADALAAVREALGGAVDTDDADQVAALIAILGDLDAQIDALVGNVPLGTTVDVAGIVADLDLGELADLVTLLPVEVPELPEVPEVPGVPPLNL